MFNIKKHTDFPKLSNSSFIKEKKILGICAGMQVLFDKSEEGKEAGLGLIVGNVIKFDENKNRVPHMGWNKVYGDNFFQELNNKDFILLTVIMLNVKKFVLGYSNYSLEFPSFVKSNNISGIQFHPEKSSVNGINLLKKVLF